MRTVLFHRRYRRFHGGHLKVWHYFNHVIATPGFDARVLFDVNTSWDSSNPWSMVRERVLDSLSGSMVDVLFVAGRDWQRLEAIGLLDRGLPTINLIQHVRHADEWSIQSRYLDRRAVRICVSEEVAAVVNTAGSNGPVLVIPNGVDIPRVDGRSVRRKTDLMIAGLKQPALAARLARRLARPGRSIDVLTEYVPREAFLDGMRRARVTLYLPNKEEGFYLPALEGMALGTIVVCPDCIGNRSYCLPGHNAFRPSYEAGRIVLATRSALELDAAEAKRLRANARKTARHHSLEVERDAFAKVLTNLDALWESD